MTARALILVVEDEPSILHTLADVLTWEGYDVVMAEHGQKALEEIAKAVPSIVLSDYMMPVMDGLKLLQTLRAREDTRLVPFILMTAASKIEETDEIWDELLKKPFNVKDLVGAIERCLSPDVTPS